MNDLSVDNSDYSDATLEKANALFFVIQEQEPVTPDVIEQFEYVTAKKYTFGLLNYAKYMLAPETLCLVPPANLEAHVVKAFRMLMMVSLKNGGAYSDDFEKDLRELSPRLAAYQSNARNREQLALWRNPNRTGHSPRILEKLICTEANVFVKRWRIKTPVVYLLPHSATLLTHRTSLEIRKVVWQRPSIP